MLSQTRHVSAGNGLREPRAQGSDRLRSRRQRWRVVSVAAFHVNVRIPSSHWSRCDVVLAAKRSSISSVT